MNIINLSKAYCLDENMQFKNCNICDIELTPFCITSEELNKLPIETVTNFLQAELLRLNQIGEDKHLLFVCKKCLNLEKN